MKLLRALAPAVAGVLSALPLSAQHARVSAVVIDPTNPARVWVCNRDNDSVSVVDTSTASPVVTEIPVGVRPRTLAFSQDGSTVFVANQRGNVPTDRNFVTPFDGSEQRGTVSVIDAGLLQVTTTLTNVGVEPYGIAVAPNGKWFAVSGFRSGTIQFYDTASLTHLATHQYLRNLNSIPAPFTMADVDSNRDGIADLGDPRGFVIRSDSTRMYVTHNKSPFVSVLDLTLDVNGKVTGVVEAAKIDTDEYPFDTFFNPVPVQTVESQGLPRFLEDIALSPDGTRAVVPHLLHNVNHDVNHDFGPDFPGAFANRVYPALTVLDAVANSYGQAGDTSVRLEHELSDDRQPAEASSYGDVPETSLGDRLVLGLENAPLLGQPIEFVVSGYQPGDDAVLIYGNNRANLPFGTAGTLLVSPRFQLPMPNGRATITVPNLPGFVDLVLHAQALVAVGGGSEQWLTNGTHFRLDTAGPATNAMGHRAAHPSRVTFNDAGDHLLMLNRGSEDIFLYAVDGSDLTLRSVFPPRLYFQERAPLDTTTPMGDLPLGFAMAPDPSTVNDDALLYVINEGTRTLSTLRVDFTAGFIQEELPQVSTLTGPDAFTLSERIGEELFEDASRPQTTGEFNNSCASCHFEGGADGNVWQRPAGPRSTMPVYGGTLATGMILWKGVRLHMGETGPMFGGENGGTGAFTQAEVDGLRDYHETIPIPLNPNIDPLTGDLTPNAAFGRDLFFGTNATGMNPNNRVAGCATCHPDNAATGPFPGPRFYTADFIFPQLSGGDVANFDPNCTRLRENLLAENLRNVNTGANIDSDNDGNPDVDRNADGYSDLETYAIMNADTDDDFKRDDTNNYLCPCDPQTDPNCDPQDPFRLFARDEKNFSIPTKLGVFGSGPYFHDHAAFSLRALLNAEMQTDDPVYGSPAFPGQPAYPGLNKVFNGVHDVLGHTDLGGVSEVQLTLQTPPGQEMTDLLAILDFIQSL